MKKLSTVNKPIYCLHCKRIQVHSVTIYDNLTERKCQVCGETTITLKERSVPA